MRTHLLRLKFLALMAPVVLAGCHRNHLGDPMLSTQGYRYRTGVSVVGPQRDTLRVAVVVVNETNEQRMLPLSRCPLWASAIQAEVSSRGHNWNSEVYEERLHHVVYRDARGNPITEACGGSLLAMKFPPGASFTSEFKLPVREILGDSLPKGRYRVTSRLITSGGDGRKLDAGEVVL
jgi:hypothetical protein